MLRSLKHSSAPNSALNTHSNDFIRRRFECVTSRKRKNRFGSCCEGWGWFCWWRENHWFNIVSFVGMTSMNINSDWISNASSGLCIILGCISYIESCHHIFLISSVFPCFFPFSLCLFFPIPLFSPLLSLAPLSFLSSLSLLFPFSLLSFLSSSLSLLFIFSLSLPLFLFCTVKPHFTVTW